MTTRLLYPLGNSDIRINGELLEKKMPFYKITEFIFKNIEEFNLSSKRTPTQEKLSLKHRGKGLIFEELTIKRIDFPIFSDLWFYILSKNYNKKPDEVILFATRQNPIHKKDTYYLGKIIKYILNKIFFKSENNGIIINLIESDPSDYENMDRYFANIIHNSLRERLKKSSITYVQTSTGTPAISFNLSIHLSSLPLCIKYLYVKDNKNKDLKERVKEIQYFEISNIKRYKEIIGYLLDAYEYASAKKVLKNSPLKNNSTLEALLDIMIARRDLRFENGLSIARDRLDESKKEFFGILEYFSNILEGKNGHRIWASFEEMEIYIERNEYHVALASFFNILENIVEYLIHEEGKDIEDMKEKDGKYFSYIKKVEWLKENAQSKRNKPLYTLLFDKEFAQVEQKLREKRNRGPLAHGFQPITDEDRENINKIRQKLNNELKSVALKEINEKNFYKYMRDIIDAYLEKIQNKI